MALTSEVPEDPASLKMNAEAGCRRSMIKLALSYVRGENKDYSEAIRLLKVASNETDVDNVTRDTAVDDSAVVAGARYNLALM